MKTSSEALRSPWVKAAAVIAFGLGLTSGVEAQSSSLEARISALEAELAALKQEATSSTTRVDHRGLSLSNRDGDFNFSLRGAIHGDARYYSSDEAVEDEFLFRRIRPTLNGQLGRAVSFRITPEVAGSSVTLLDAYVDLALTDTASLRIGQFKSPVSLERLQSGNALALIERAYAAEVAGNRDLGLQLQGRSAANTVSYALGIFNGAPDGRNSGTGNADSNFELAGRLFFEPFRNEDSPLKGLGFGIAGSIGDKSGSGNDFLPRYRSPGQQTIFSYLATTAAEGRHTRFSPQGYLYTGPFGLQGEFIRSRQKLIHLGTGVSSSVAHDAWQVTASWVLTGEDAGYGGVTPSRPIGSGPTAGWGAFEVVIRASELDLDSASFLAFADPDRAVSSAESYGLGLNWYLSRNLKTAITYQHSRFDGGAANGSDRGNENLVFGRFQLAF